MMHKIILSELNHHCCARLSKYRIYIFIMKKLIYNMTVKMHDM